MALLSRNRPPANSSGSQRRPKPEGAKPQTTSRIRTGRSPGDIAVPVCAHRSEICDHAAGAKSFNEGAFDDLDRCLTDTIVDAFEAIRLFLLRPKTAYVMAADQRVVQAVIESRYPVAREGV